MDENIVGSITSKIVEFQDKNSCWNVLSEGDKYYPEFNYELNNS